MEYQHTEEVLYVIEVFGYAPEFWPAMAFRKDGSKKNENPAEPERQKEIKCPACGKLFMVVNHQRRLNLVRFSKRFNAPCHEYRKCHKCHERIGVRYKDDLIHFA